MLETLEDRVLCADTAGNNPGLARNLGTVTAALTVAESVSTTDPDDFFKFTTTAPGQMTVRIDGLSSNANLQLFDGTGATMLAGSSNTGTTADQIAMSVPAGNFMVHVKWSGPSAASYSLKITPPTATTRVNLSSAFNANGIINDGTATSAPGFDFSNDFYSRTLLTSTVNANGQAFNIGPANTNNIVRALGQKITLPAGKFASLQFLGASSNSPNGQPNQTFRVNYTDGTSQSFVRGVSDWGSTGATFANETIAKTMAYRLFGGNPEFFPPRLYAYSLAINSAKTVSSLTLPDNAVVALFAVDLVPTVPAFTEPGGTAATATNIGNVGTNVIHLANSINKTTDTADFYKLTTTANGLLKFVGTGKSANPPQGDFTYTFSLYASNGTTLLKTFSMNNFPTFSPTFFHGTAATTYFVKISGSGDTSTSYTLDISNGVLPPNKAGDTRATATSTATAPTGPASAAFIVNTFNQNDWWKKTFTAGTQTVTITDSNSTVPLKMEIVNSAGTVVATASFENPFELTAIFNTPTATTYFIHVFQSVAGANGSASPYYFSSL